jgi:Flp pilus assembly pilin Flp
VIKVWTLVRFINGLRNRDEGQTLTEYGLILFFIAVVAVFAVTLLGERVAEIFDDIRTALS